MRWVDFWMGVAWLCVLAGIVGLALLPLFVGK